MELIPAIDLRGGRVVRLFQGDFAAETRYELAPEELYARYARAGAGRVHIVDLDGARDGQAGNRPVVAALVALGRIRVQCGGGLRSSSSVQALLDTGVDRAVIGSVAVTAPAEVIEWLGAFGAERLVLALDVREDGESSPGGQIHSISPGQVLVASVPGVALALAPEGADGRRPHHLVIHLRGATTWCGGPTTQPESYSRAAPSSTAKKRSWRFGRSPGYDPPPHEDAA